MEIFEEIRKIKRKPRRKGEVKKEGEEESVRGIGSPVSTGMTRVVNAGTAGTTPECNFYASPVQTLRRVKLKVPIHRCLLTMPTLLVSR